MMEVTELTAPDGGRNIWEVRMGLSLNQMRIRLVRTQPESGDITVHEVATEKREGGHIV